MLGRWFQSWLRGFQLSVVLRVFFPFLGGLTASLHMAACSGVRVIWFMSLVFDVVGSGCSWMSAGGMGWLVSRGRGCFCCVCLSVNRLTSLPSGWRPALMTVSGVFCWRRSSVCVLSVGLSWLKLGVPSVRGCGAGTLGIRMTGFSSYSGFFSFLRVKGVSRISTILLRSS